jgi:hypothetical protein
MSKNEKEVISFDDAVKHLPDAEQVHTFREAGFTILGADWDKPALLNAMRKAPEIQVTGPQAQAMRHGLCIFDDHGPLFIETANAQVQARPEAVACNDGLEG